MSKYDHAKFLIERFDHYYDSVNNKGAFYIALNTFIFGGLCVGYFTLDKDIDVNAVIWVLLSILLTSNLISTVFTVLATMPFLKDNDEYKQKPSLTFFGGIARHQVAHFKEKLLASDDTALLDDAIQQAYSLAVGLDGKYKKLGWASYLLVIQFITMIPLILIVAKNLK